jgi:hypothetical protein
MTDDKESLENKVNSGLNENNLNKNNVNSRKNHNFFTRRMRDLAAWGIRKHRTKKTSLWHKAQKEAGLTLYSALYGGNLPSKEQLEKEDLLHLEHGTLTRYSATRGFALFLGLEYSGFVEGINPLISHIPFMEKMNYTGDNAEYVYWAITAAGVAINAGRYYRAKFKHKPFPAISWYSGLVNAINLSGKGINWLLDVGETNQK